MTGPEVEAVRRDKGWTKQQMAEWGGVTAETIRKYERGGVEGFVAHALRALSATQGS